MIGAVAHGRRTACFSMAMTPRSGTNCSRPPTAVEAWRLERFGDQLVSLFPKFQVFRWAGE